MIFGAIYSFCFSWMLLESLQFYVVWKVIVLYIPVNEVLLECKSCSTMDNVVMCSWHCRANWYIQWWRHLPVRQQSLWRCRVQAQVLWTSKQCNRCCWILLAVQNMIANRFSSLNAKHLEFCCRLALKNCQKKTFLCYFSTHQPSDVILNVCK